VKAKDTLDCVGLYCPMPIVQTAERIRSLNVGDILEVLGDDQGIEKDMAAWCQTTGNEFLGSEQQDGEYRVYVRRAR
jgi:tRNA 2-thiouridine synthesizing protein A